MVEFHRAVIKTRFGHGKSEKNDLNQVFDLPIDKHVGVYGLQ